MQLPLYFHVRKGHSHTYCISPDSNGDLAVGYSVTHKNDHFCKKVGRKIAETRMKTIMAEEGEEVANTEYINPYVGQSLRSVVSRAKELLNLEGPLKVKTLVSKDHKKKVGIIHI